MLPTVAIGGRAHCHRFGTFLRPPFDGGNWPSPIYPVQLVYELFLRSMPVSFNHHFHSREMAFHRLFAGCDDGFVTEWLASRVLSGVRLAYQKLSDGSPQKIEAHLPLIFLKRVGNSGFAGF